MKKICIIAAIDEEFDAIEQIMKNKEHKLIYEIEIIEGTINNKECILAKSGVGKVNAARTTQILIDKYDIDYVINIGSAGGLKNDLNIGDIIIGTKIVQHDFNITAFGHKRGYVSGVGDILLADEELIKKAKIAMQSIEKQNIKSREGIIATGDIFVTKIKMKESIVSEFDADCTEMEGAAIAQVCTLDKIPFIIIRSISDIPNGNNNVTFKEFINVASKRTADFIKNMV